MAAITVTQFRCALYAGISTKDKGQEVGQQLRQLREFANHSGWTIVAEYIEHESGKISDREQFQAMFEAASKRRFYVLLFWSLDRLGREGALPTLQHLQRLTVRRRPPQFHRSVFHTCGVFKEAVVAIVATVARQERIRISERVRAGLSTARNKGREAWQTQSAFPAARLKPCARKACPGGRLPRSSTPAPSRRGEPTPPNAGDVTKNHFQPGS